MGAQIHRTMQRSQLHRSAQTQFSNVAQASTSGNGSGAIFTISIDGSGNYSVAAINSGGSGYEPDDSITVSGASFGGTSPAHDLTITINNIITTSGAILHIDNISINRANEPQTIIEGIDISIRMPQLRPQQSLLMQKNKLNSETPI